MAEPDVVEGTAEDEGEEDVRAAEGVFGGRGEVEDGGEGDGG